MIDIPKNMTNDESKLIAQLICQQRICNIENGLLFGLKNRVRKYYEQRIQS